MRDTKSWISRAEEYCRAEGVDKIVHPTKKYLYDLYGVADEVTVALFDSDGFLLIRRGDLAGAWGDGYFPSGIKVYDGYLTRDWFRETGQTSEAESPESGKPVNESRSRRDANRGCGGVTTNSPSPEGNS